MTHPLLKIPMGRGLAASYVRELIDVSRAIVPQGIDERHMPPTSLDMLNAGNVGSIQNLLPLTAEDRGASAGSQINIAAHTADHGGTVVTYGVGTLIVDDAGADLSYSNGGNVFYHVYVDNAEYANLTAPAYKATTDETKLATPGRYRVGSVLMPTDGGGTTYGGGGGGGGTTGDGTVTNPGQAIP